MPTFTDLLPPSKTHKHRAVKYTPACRGVGVLELTDSRTHVRYALAVQPFGGVRLSKADGETYVVTPTACECAGFVYSRTGSPCKHVEAVSTLLANGWLDLAADDRETVADPREAAEELDAYYAAGEYAGDGPDRLADDWHAAAVGGRIVQELGGC